jgi:hypothetical protein
MTETTSAATPAPASRWEDFVDILYAPASVFARRATAGFGIPMLVVTVLVGGIFLVTSGALQPMLDAEFTRAMAAKIRSDPSLTPERVEMAREMGQKFQKVGVFIILPVTMFVVGLMLWLCGKLVDARQTLGAALMVTCYAYVPKVLEAVLAGVQALVLDPSSLNGRFRLTLGIGRFLDPDATSPILLAVVGRIDLFTIRVTVLLAIGLSVTGKVPRRSAVIAAALVWALGAVPGVLQALGS